MKVEIVTKAFSALAYLAEYERERKLGAVEQEGAASIFVGTMRNNSAGKNVVSMRIESYPGMTETYIEKFADEANEKFALLDLLIAHRVGDIVPGETIVLIASWSEHRKTACEATWQILEELKSRAPLWKKEYFGGSSRWVEKNTAGAVLPW